MKERTNEGHEDEAALRRAVLRGDEAAWRALFDRHFRPLYAYVLYKTHGDVMAAEEITQDCWLVAVKRIRKFNPERSSFSTWLHGIANNLVNNYRRKSARRAELTQHVECPTQDGRPHHDDRVALAMAGLPKKYQAVIRAKYVMDQSVKRIAEQWGQSPKAVESLLTRAREAFKNAYTKLDE